MGSSKPTFTEKTHLGSFSLNMKVFLLSVAFSVTIISAGPMPQDPNDDAEVFSGPIDSNAGDPDYDYFGSIFPRPRVRVIVVPIAPDYSDNEDYDYPLPTFGHSPPSFNPLSISSEHSLDPQYLQIQLKLMQPETKTSPAFSAPSFVTVSTASKTTLTVSRTKKMKLILMSMMTVLMSTTLLTPQRFWMTAQLFISTRLQSLILMRMEILSSSTEL